MRMIARNFWVLRWMLGMSEIARPKNIMSKQALIVAITSHIRLKAN